MSLKSNIVKLYLIKIAKWFMLFMPIVVPFYQSNGLGMQEVLILQGIYSVTIVILEIPSGYFADVLGRKRTIILGSFMGFFGFLTYSVSFGFWGFLLAEVILGIGQSLISGADSAMLYDTLLDLKKEKKYIKYEGRLTSLGNIAEAIAGTLGGLLAGISLRSPYIAQTMIAFIGIPAAISLIEPARHKRMLDMRFRDIIDIVKIALFRDKTLQKNILFSSIIGTSTLTMAWFVQPFLQKVEIPIELFGFIWTALNLTVGLVALIAYRIEMRLGQRNSLILITLLIPGGYFALSQSGSIPAISILFLFYMVRGFATPVLKDYIHKLTGSEIRATVLSVRNFIIRLNFALIGPFLGWYTDYFSLSQALFLAGILFFIFSGITLLLFIIEMKHQKKHARHDDE